MAPPSNPGWPATSLEVPGWLSGGPEPSTVSETMFRADRLKTMRMRLSAAYKGVNALLMKEGAQDFPAPASHEVDGKRPRPARQNPDVRVDQEPPLAVF